MTKNIFLDEICDRVLCEAAESFKTSPGSALVALDLCTLIGFYSRRLKYVS